MKMRKIIPALSILALAGVLAACGPTDAPAESTPTSTAPADPWETPEDYVPFGDRDPDSLNTEITFWHTFGESNSANYVNITAIVSEFQNRFPNIKVTLVNNSSYDQIRTNLLYAITAHTLPTMAIAYPDHVADYLYSGVVENMAGYVSDPTIGLGAEDGTDAGGLDDYYPNYLEEGTGYAETGVYSMPYSKSTEVMFYNKTFFDLHNLTVPQTWEDMWEVCEQIKAIDSSVTPFGYDSDDNLYITRSEQAGIPFTTASGDGADHYLFNNADAKAMVQEYKDAYDNGYFVTKGTSADSSYTSTMFTERSLYMTVGSTGGTNYNYTSDFEVAVAGIPQEDTNDAKVISQGPSICFFNEASDDQLYAAWLFYKFATNATNTANLSTLTGYNPVRRSAFETDLYKNWVLEEADDGQSMLVRTVLEYADANYGDAYFTSPAFRGSSTARVQVGGIITNVLLGTLTMDEAFDSALTNCVIAS